MNVHNHSVQVSKMKPQIVEKYKPKEGFTKAQIAQIETLKAQSPETVVEMANLLDIHNKIVATTKNSRYILIFPKDSSLDKSIANLFLNFFPDNVGVSIRDEANQDKITVLSRRSKFGPSRATLLELKAEKITDSGAHLSMHEIQGKGFTLNATACLLEAAEGFPQLIQG